MSKVDVWVQGGVSLYYPWISQPRYTYYDSSIQVVKLEKGIYFSKVSE